eukprot:14080373-Alexandrium_andersonii.AAC.1
MTCLVRRAGIPASSLPACQGGRPPELQSRWEDAVAIPLWALPSLRGGATRSPGARARVRG